MNALPALPALSTPANPAASGSSTSSASSASSNGAARHGEDAPKFSRELQRATKPAENRPARAHAPKEKAEAPTDAARRFALQARPAAEDPAIADAAAALAGEDGAERDEPLDTEAPADAATLLAGLLNPVQRTPEAVKGTGAQAPGDERVADGVKARRAPPGGADGAATDGQDARAATERAPTAAEAGAAFALPAAPLAPAPRPEAVATGADVRVPSHVASPEFAPALGAQVSLLVKDGVQEARLQLNPAELGPVTVQIQVDGSQAQVTFAAEHAFTRERIEESLPMLAGALQESGLTLTGGGVFEQQPRQPQGDGAPSSFGGRGGSNGRSGSEGGDGDTLAAAPRPAARAARGGVDVYA